MCGTGWLGEHWPPHLPPHGVALSWMCFGDLLPTHAPMWSAPAEAFCGVHGAEGLCHPATQSTVIPREPPCRGLAHQQQVQLSSWLQVTKITLPFAGRKGLVTRIGVYSSVLEGLCSTCHCMYSGALPFHQQGRASRQRVAVADLQTSVSL